MGADKADIHHFVGVVDPHDKSILVSRDIEHHTAISKDAGIPEMSISSAKTWLSRISKLFQALVSVLEAP